MTGHPSGPQMAHGHEVALNNAYGRQFNASGCDYSQHPTRDRRALVVFYAVRLIEGIAIKFIRVLYHNPELAAWICKKPAIMGARPCRLGAPNAPPLVLLLMLPVFSSLLHFPARSGALLPAVRCTGRALHCRLVGIPIRRFISGC